MDLSRIAAALREIADALEAGGVENAPGGGGNDVISAGRRCTRVAASAGKDMLSPVEFGRRFGRSASWAKDLCRRGELPGAFRLPNKRWTIPEAAVAAYVASRQAPDVPIGTIRPRTTGSISDWRKLRPRSAA